MTTGETGGPPGRDLDAARAHPGPRSGARPDPRRELGRRAEDLAGAFLESLGMAVQARNWRTARGEIDLVARDGACLVLVEVRARRGPRLGTPEESVGPAKQRRLALLAETFVQQTGWPGAWRIDVVAVQVDAAGGAEVRHYPSAVGR